MAMERETRTLLKALVDGQVKLAEGLKSHAKTTNTAIQRLSTDVRQLTTDVRQLTTDVRYLGKRMDRYATAVVRGFTNGTRRDHVIEKRVGVLEARVTSLEQK